MRLSAGAAPCASPCKLEPISGAAAGAGLLAGCMSWECECALQPWLSPCNPLCCCPWSCPCSQKDCAGSLGWPPSGRVLVLLAECVDAAACATEETSILSAPASATAAPNWVCKPCFTVGVVLTEVRALQLSPAVAATPGASPTAAAHVGVLRVEGMGWQDWPREWPVPVQAPAGCSHVAAVCVPASWAPEAVQAPGLAPALLAVGVAEL